MSNRNKKHIITAISLLFIFLFTYTAASKLSNANALIGNVARHPLFSTYAKPIAWTVISLEWLAVVLLFYGPFRLYGWYLTTGLMIAFTFYIGSMLWMKDRLPCSCGGILKEISWSSHFILNIILSLLAITGLVLERQKRREVIWT